MTKALSAPPTTSPAYATSGNRGRSKSKNSTTTWIIAFGAVVVLGVAGLVGWNILENSRAAASALNAERFTVEPRSFSVVLNEKGELKAAKSTEITCQVEGRSTIISIVPEGTTVTAGDLLVELASDQIEDRIRQETLKESNALTAYESSKTELEIQKDKNDSDLRKAKLKIELMQLALDKYEKGDWVEREKDADVAIERAEISLANRKEDFKAAEELLERDYMTRIKFKQDEFNFKTAEWDLEKAIKAKEVLQTYTHVADLRQRESDLEEAQKEAERAKKTADAEVLKKERQLEAKSIELDLVREQLTKLQRQMKNCRITAPTQGIVVYYSGGGGMHFMSSDSQIREGASVHERQIMLTLPDTSEMQVIVRIHEAKTDKIALDQDVRIRVEGVPDRVFTGKVTKIAAVADTQNRWLNPDLKEYETEITLDPTDFALKPGVTAQAEILVESVKDQLAVPVQSIYTKGSGRYVFRADARASVAVPVRLGAIGTEWAQVSEGLSAGQQVLLAFSDAEKRLIPDVPQGKSGGGMKTRRPASTSRRPASHGASPAAHKPSGRPSHAGGAHSPSGKKMGGKKKHGSMSHSKRSSP